PCFAGALDSLNCVGTGADGRWYFGPTAQPESATAMTRPMATAPDRAAEIRRRVTDKVVVMNVVRSMLIPTFRRSVRSAPLQTFHRQDSREDLRSPRLPGLFR